VEAKVDVSYAYPRKKLASSRGIENVSTYSPEVLRSRRISDIPVDDGTVHGYLDKSGIAVAASAAYIRGDPALGAADGADVKIASAITAPKVERT
jgi:hypothetical protein